MDKMIQDAVSSLLQANVAAILSFGKKGAAQAKEQLLIASGLAFRSYYENASKKYGYTKTILYRTNPVRLYDFYVHVSLGTQRTLTGRFKSVVQTEHVSQPLAASKHLILTGTAGSGKSTLLKHFFLDALNVGSHLPLFVELRDLNDSPRMKLLDFMHDALHKLGLDISKEQFLQLLEGGKFLLLLDAFDELSVKLSRRVEREIINFRDQFGHNSILLSSRPDERFIGWSNFTEFSVLPLSKSQALKLISNLDYDSNIKQLFWKAVDERLYDSHTSFLQNPLLLTLMLMTYDQFGDIPGKTHLFYAQAFDTLFTKHDASKSGYKREFMSGLAADDFQDVLSAFCVVSYFNNQTSFSRADVMKTLDSATKILGGRVKFQPEDFIADLLRSLCILLQEGLHFVFAHRTFQEYFAARYIVKASPEQRKALLEKARPRIGRDTLFSLAWEMDQRAVEDDFLIGFLRDITAKARVNSLADHLAFKNFLPLVYEYLTLEQDNVVSLTIRDESLFDLITRICELYPGNSGPFSDWTTKEEVQEYRVMVSQHLGWDKSKSALRIGFELDLKHPRGHVDATLAQVWEHEETLNRTLRILRYYRWQLSRLVETQQQIVGRQHSQATSLEKLLHSPSPKKVQKKSRKH